MRLHREIELREKDRYQAVERKNDWRDDQPDQDSQSQERGRTRGPVAEIAAIAPVIRSSRFERPSNRDRVATPPPETELAQWETLAAPPFQANYRHN